MSSLIGLAEAGWVPDPLIRVGIRQLVKQRLREERRQPQGTKVARTEALRESAVALHTDAANEQHYELPTTFFENVLGPRLKYSACVFPHDNASLAEAELHTLEMYRERLAIEAGDTVLDLGCGWGSFSLWLAEREPLVDITAVSNSTTQREYIETRARALGLENLRVITQDVNRLDLPADTFTKIISVEMFEHVRNYAELMRRISRWLRPGGSLFTHIFCHKDLIYPFETEGESNWMGRYFFTGGLMPAADTLLAFQEDLSLQHRWLHDGTHYERTARAWLENMDERVEDLRPSLENTYGAGDVNVWQQRWRMFFMACEEMFAYDRGNQWQVAHYLFTKAKSGG